MTGSLLDMEALSASIAGALSDAVRAAGRHAENADIAIATIAEAHELASVTLSQLHFEPLGAEIVNPLAPL